MQAVTFEEIKNINPYITVIHLYGKFEMEEMIANNISFHPKQNGHAEYMSKTLTHIGMKPTLNLLAAGLKVGELMQKNKTFINKIFKKYG